jgi:hypothetical protein
MGTGNVAVLVEAPCSHHKSLSNYSTHPLCIQQPRTSKSRLNFFLIYYNGLDMRDKSALEEKEREFGNALPPTRQYKQGWVRPPRHTNQDKRHTQAHHTTYYA